MADARSPKKKRQRTQEGLDGLLASLGPDRGRAPLAGESSTDGLAAILDKEPPPLSRYADETPQELQHIVTKWLRKGRDERCAA